MTNLGNLLVVDDDIIFSDVLAEVLREKDFQVRTATSAQQVLELDSAWHPNYAIVDLRIGRDSGLQVSRYLLQNFKHIRIVMLTGYASIATAVEAIKMGVVHYLIKPVDVEEILTVLLTDTLRLDVELNASPPSIKRLEWEHIQKTLNQCQGNISEAARKLGMHRRTLQRKLNKRPVKR